MVQLSGGEPTIHPDIEEMVEICFARGVRKVYINTNGIRLAKEPELHLPSGELDQTPSGMPMEGRLPGCQACHVAVRANDYIFTSPLSGGGR